MINKLPLRYKIAAAAGAAGVMLIVGIAAFAADTRDAAAIALVSHTHEVIETTDAVLQRLVDAETAERGYLLTGDTAYLAPYQGADADVRRNFQRVKILTNDNPLQQQRLDSLGPVVESRLDALDRVIRAREDSGAAAGERAFRSSTGRQYMEDARRIVGSFQGMEQQLLARRTSTEHARAVRTQWIIVVGTLVAFLLAAFTVASLSRAAAFEAEAAQRLREQQAELEMTNQQLQEQAAELEATNEELQSTTEELAEQTSVAERNAGEARDAQRLAEDANQAKSSFLATMSHELRTPLNAIAGYAELLVLGLRGPVTPEQTQDLEAIRRSEEHLLGLINSILAFARLEASQEQIKLGPVRMVDAIATVEALIKPQIGGKGLGFDTSGARPDVVAHADRHKVAQILTNLVSNAIKFTARGGSVSVSCESNGSKVYVHVKDTGRGIPEADMTRIFEPFVQLDRQLSRPVEGVGLGLPISRALARAMGGDLTAKSVPGDGSTFTLVLKSESD
ncbi:MAG TPA: CHASE3 domain-containing protein [Gemmatimonadaceae bacterium]|nr:CHASE3 domain-containing protein [Gemmatimonadaceae bacterium]